MLVYQILNNWMGVRTNLQLEGICAHAPHHHHRQGAKGLDPINSYVKSLKSHYIPLAPLFSLAKSAENRGTPKSSIYMDFPL